MAANINPRKGLHEYEINCMLSVILIGRRQSSQAIVATNAKLAYIIFFSCLQGNILVLAVSTHSRLSCLSFGCLQFNLVLHQYTACRSLYCNHMSKHHPYITLLTVYLSTVRTQFYFYPHIELHRYDISDQISWLTG